LKLTDKLPHIPPPLKKQHPNARHAKRLQLKSVESLGNWINKSSGQYIHDQKPELYKRIVAMLASPEFSFKDIREATGITWPTIRAIYEREPEAIKGERKRLCRQYARLERLLLERVEEHAVKDTVSDRDALFGISVARHSQQLLTGEATSHNLTMSVNATVDIAGEFAKLHETIRAAKPVKQIDGTSTSKTENLA